MHRGCRAAASIDWYNGIVSDLALADRALTVVGVDVDPLVEALPAEEMAALCHNWVISHLKADVALEICSIAPSLVVRLIGIGICIGSRGRRIVVCEGGWCTSWLWARAMTRSGGAPLLSLLATQFLQRRVTWGLRGVVVVVDRAVALLLVVVPVLMLVVLMLVLLMIVRLLLLLLLIVRLLLLMVVAVLLRWWSPLSPPGIIIIVGGGVGGAAVDEASATAAAAAAASTSATAGIGPAGHVGWI